MATFIDRKVGTYSGGMKRRLDIAMSLVGDASIIFLDEPTTGVDPKARQNIWQLIRQIRDQGKTVFLTTQYLDEADQLSDHIAFLNDGRIALVTTPSAIKANTKSESVLTVAPADQVKATALLDQAEIAFTTNENEITLADAAVNSALKLLVMHHIHVEALNALANDLQTVFFTITEDQSDGII
ncbi:ATP-binding cassette domain-containing protein [Lapidilactobacillus bayanensis]|uniref:ATP-binding cassette domain-containing protein n=1 Tax=Lapidilactobacillus bayanensis TaxID=2485998 RepID=UPI0013DDD195|nr:ABC transporter ATP-binding protein [Lapidilactobacillus bayanensis]